MWQKITNIYGEQYVNSKFWNGSWSLETGSCNDTIPRPPGPWSTGKSLSDLLVQSCCHLLDLGQISVFEALH